MGTHFLWKYLTAQFTRGGVVCAVGPGGIAGGGGWKPDRNVYNAFHTKSNASYLHFQSARPSHFVVHRDPAPEQRQQNIFDGTGETKRKKETGREMASQGEREKNANR